MRSSSHSKAVAHPKLRPVEFKFDNGKSFTIPCAMNVSEYHAGDWPVDSHPAWTGSDSTNLKRTDSVAKFEDRYGDLFTEE